VVVSRPGEVKPQPVVPRQPAVVDRRPLRAGAERRVRAGEPPEPRPLARPEREAAVTVREVVVVGEAAAAVVPAQKSSTPRALRRGK
jgi:hypothetical protein